jgi:hypothetical protein
MIINFKIFENMNSPKFKVGDIVYNIGDKENMFKKSNFIPIKCKVVEVIPESERPDNKCNRYMLDRYPHISVREDVLISEFEFDAKKYNL